MYMEILTMTGKSITELIKPIPLASGGFWLLLPSDQAVICNAEPH